MGAGPPPGPGRREQARRGLRSDLAGFLQVLPQRAYTPAMSLETRAKAVAIVGTNASGKSALGVAVALRFSGEIISADSRQGDRGLDIGTGKVTPGEMHGIRR